jgi:predicted transcriptional regulator YdeE
MKKMKPFNKWMLVLIVISAAFPTNTRVYGMQTKSNVAYESLSLPTFGDGTKSRVPDPASSSGEVIQNKAFAHLEIISSVAFISAGFTQPDNLDEEVMIEWFLYGWKTGWIEPILLKGNVRATAIHHVEVNTQVSVPEYDYYLFQCKNKILNSEDIWIPIFKSESRFSKIAPMNGIWERTGEVTSNSAVLHTYLTEKPPFDATELENLRVPPMAGYARFVVYSDPDLQGLVADSGYYPVDDYIQIAGQWQRTYYNFRWTVSNLEPDNDYYYRLETKSSDGLDTYLASNINSFRTSPEKYSNQPISFVVVHSLDVNNTVYEDPIESATRGLKVFDSMLTFVDHLPDFIIMQGDTVYYDGGAGYAPDVGSYLNSEFIRRWLYWCAQYQFENLMYFFQRIPGYWMVDDHDYWVNNINENKPDGWYIRYNGGKCCQLLQ